MRKRHIYLFLLLTAAVMLGGCSQQSQLEFIGQDLAENLALEAYGLSEPDAVLTSSELKSKNGTDYYCITFTVDGTEYQCDIDALTGAVIELRGPDSSTGDSTAKLLTDDSSSAAADGTSGDSAGSQTTSFGNSAGSGSSGAVLSQDDAKAKALSHAGLSSSQVTFLSCKLEWDDGRRIYDVEFYSGNREYDYEIDASTGAIIKYDYDAEHSASSSTSTISESKAREIALSQVPGASSSDIYEWETDHDDGHLEYEGKIIYNGMEYEFTIDGYSGAIREWEADRHR